ncbi:MAG: ABC transporter permease [Clostridia bacterium]|nr:ABC transporter permease [Clostridia bacterium]MBR2433579.1 ABC transporter permease [Clostridia bacterium]
MSKLKILTKRNIKEILRDPLSLVFCLGFPVIMLVLMQLVLGGLENVPANFQITSYATGICVFGYTFSMMFAAMLIAADKNSEFINRLYMAPIKKSTYLCSYFLAVLPIMIAQTIIFFALALCFGLALSANILMAILYLLPSMVLYITLGLFLGTLCKTEKQAGPISSIIISLVGMLGGVFMPVAQMGTISTIANILPFVHTAQIGTEALVGNFGGIFPHILWILGFALVFWIITITIFKKKK